MSVNGQSFKLLIFLHYRPPGVFEFNNFAKGTKAVMDAVVMATQNGATVIIGKHFEISLCT